MTDTQDRLEERQKLIDAARVSGTTVLYIGVDDYAELVAAVRQSQDIEAAARELSRLWFDIEGTGPSSYAADAVRDHGNEFVEAMWRLRAALAPKAEEAPR